MLTPLGSSFVQASPARWTRFCCLHQFSTLNSQSSMLDFLWGVQDSLGGAKARDFSRRPHSPLIAQLHEDTSCLV
jgi:hypothetical protein